MKKIVNKIKQNAKAIAAFLLGIALTGGTVYAATVLPSSQVGYDNSTSGLTATDVQDALDELNTKASAWINPVEDYQMSPNKNIIASSSGLKLIRNGHVYEIKLNNFDVEKDRIPQIFSDGDCRVYEEVGLLYCDADDFSINYYNEIRIYITDKSNGTSCEIDSDSSFSCSIIREQKGKNNTVYFDTNKTPTTSSTTDYTTLGKNVFLAKNGYQLSVCMIRNGRLHCFDHNNFLIEREHIQHVFSDVSCDLTPNPAQNYNARCVASDREIILRESTVTIIDFEGRHACETYSGDGIEITGSCWPI